MRTIRHTACLGAILLAAACGGGEKKETAKPEQAAQPAATGADIEVIATTDDKGNYFEPKEITAKPGDVLRFKLVTGVHNVDFLPDSNPGKTGLPPASAFLQLPGQTIDIPLTFGEGDFYFQCDPHALLGMKGKVHVKK